MQSTTLSTMRPNKDFSLMSTITLYSLLWILTVGTRARALTCFETNDDGDMVEVTSDEYTYCMLAPERIDNNKYVEGKAFGIGPTNDLTGQYDKLFELNTDIYQVLAMCIYEKFDFAKFSPKFTFKQPEFMLRCFCNFDRCNREKNFFGYLNNLKADSSALKAKSASEIAAESTETRR